MNKPKPPCPKKCLHRSAECRITCAEWLDYEKQRNVFYEWRAAQMELTRVQNDIEKDRGKAIKSGNFSRKRRKK